MIVNDKPSLAWVIILFAIATAIVTDPAGIGYLNSTSSLWVVPIACILYGVSALKAWDWIRWQSATHQIWENTARGVQMGDTYRTVQALSTMDAKRLEGLVYILALQYGPEEDRPQALEYLRDAVAEIKQGAAEYAAAYPSRQYYALQAIDYAKQNKGMLPVLRDIGDDTAKRNALEKLYKELEAAGLVRRSPGHQAQIVGEKYDAAEQVARKMEGIG